MSTPNGWSRGDYWACWLSLLAAVLLAVAPHIAVRSRFGTWDYIPDGDDIFYLSVARQPYYGENFLRDPISSKRDRVPSMYPWFQFVPLTTMARLLGFPMIRVGLFWRIFGGLWFGVALFGLFRRLFRDLRHPTAWALGSSLICLSDAGFVLGRSFVQNAEMLRQLWNGIVPAQAAAFLVQHRVLNPLVSLPALLMLATNLLDLSKPTTRAVAAGAVLFSLCILTNFYFWTAAALALGIYFLLLLAQAWRRPRERNVLLPKAWTLVFIVAAGLAIGSPQILSNFRTFSKPALQPILERVCKGQTLEPNDPVRRLYVKNFWAWGKLAVGAAGIAVFPAAGLEVLWCLTLAGYLLANNALITGREFENFHWVFVHAPFGEIMVLAILCRLIDRRRSLSRLQAAWIWLLPVCLTVLAFLWRPYEALRAVETGKLSRTMEQLRPLRSRLAALGPDCALAGGFGANVALLFTQCARVYQLGHTANCTLLSDDEVHARNAFDSWLQGMDLDSYMEGPARDRMGVFQRPEWKEEAILPLRRRLFERLLAGPNNTYLDRYRPTALLLPTDSPPPRPGGYWKLNDQTPQWSLWIKK